MSQASDFPRMLILRARRGCPEGDGAFPYQGDQWGFSSVHVDLHDCISLCMEVS